jgi:general secretion pathway protein G
MNSKRRRAFTLIELLVVILILGILAAMIVPRVIGHSTDAKIKKATSDLASLGTYLQSFHLNCDRYPTTEEGLQALRTQPTDATGWKGPYITKDVPLDPWGHEYVYECPGANGDDSFTLLCYGADGAQGGEGDNADITDGD